MTLNASKIVNGGGGNRVEQPVLEAGNYPARLVQIIDLGLQAQRPFNGEEKAPAYSFSLSYELSTEFMRDADGNEDEGKPRWISEDMPLHSLKADKAKSTKRYNVFDTSGKYNGDWTKLVTFPCTVTIANNTNAKAGKTYANISNITPPMKGFPTPPLKNTPKIFTLDDPDMEVFFSLPEWLQEKIKGNLEYAGSLLEKHINGDTPPPKKEAEPVDDQLDDCPF